MKRFGILFNAAAWCLIMVSAVLLLTYAKRNTEDADALQRKLAQNIIRFHVRANSDSDEDQELKLKVKEALVEYMEPLLEEAESVDEARAVLSANIDNIEYEAKRVISGENKEYNVEVYFENSYFPVKTYGDMTFPAGWYEAFRVDIGDAEGKNWWCVLYPRLCFVDVSYGVVPQESKDELAAVLDEDEFALISGGAGSQEKEGSAVYEFKFLRFLNRFLQ